MTRIRIIIEDQKPKEVTYKGETKHYVEIDTRNYGLDQLTRGTYDSIKSWAQNNGITLEAWEKLEEILERCEIA